MKCGVVVFNIVDHQNAHNMIIIVKTFVKLFKSMKREKKLNKKIFIFFILYDHKSMRIYEHYLMIKNKKTTFSYS